MRLGAAKPEAARPKAAQPKAAGLVSAADIDIDSSASMSIQVVVAREIAVSMDLSVFGME